MNRSPLFYPLNRGIDSDAGGAADLQTDVMRFMAILSLCLVAIFALVQSIPLAPTQAEPVEAIAAVEERNEPDPPVAEQTATPVELTRPVPAKMPKPEAAVALERPKPARPVPAEPIEKTEPEIVEEPVKTQKHFVLRFESDVVLTTLVERDVVGLYAIAPSSIHRMQIDAGRMSFWPASAPQRFHEMDVATVPDTVIDAWQRSQPARNIQWGVSLPAPMARDLNDHLVTRDGGSLVIGRDGKLRLEP